MTGRMAPPSSPAHPRQVPARDPYLNRAMIRSANDFYGRRKEAQHIMSRLGASAPQSVSLVGERRMGKSSLLWHLAQSEVRAAHLDEPERYVFPYLDFQGHQNLDRAGFCRLFGQCLSDAAGDRLSVGDLSDLSDLDGLAREMERAGLRLVCLFDEFEAVTGSPALGAGFFGALRSLANQYGVGYVTATRQHLQTMCHNRQIWESPFFNIFTEVRVGAMPDDEVEQLIAVPSAAAGVPLAEHGEAIRCLGGNLPFFVQLACSAAFELLQQADGKALDPAALERAFMEEAASHFTYTWDCLSPEQRRIAKALASGDTPPPTDNPAAVALTAEGYVRVDDAGPRLFSEGFAHYVGQLEWRPSRPWPLRAPAVYLWPAAPALLVAVLLSLTGQKEATPAGEAAPPAVAIPQQGRVLEQAAPSVAVSLEPLPAHVRLLDVRMGDLYASLSKRYEDRATGSAVIANEGAEPVQGTISVFLPDYMRRPWQRAVEVDAGSRVEVELMAPLDAAVLGLAEATRVHAQVTLALAGDDAGRGGRQEVPVTLHGRGVLTWEEVGAASAFITSRDASVEAFARTSLVAFEEEVGARGRPAANLMRAMVLFEALRQHGVRYVRDPNGPFGRATAQRSAVDHIQYPAEVLAGKTGDCDDLTVLYCSLLENAGVPTALVDYPEHIFMLFDTGISRREAFLLPMEERLLEVRGDRVWLPVEITRLSDGFLPAWEAGAEEMGRLPPQRRRSLVTDTADGWARYPPATPRFDKPAEAPGRDLLADAVASQSAALDRLMEEWIQRTYVRRLEESSRDGTLWLRLGRVYVALRKYPEAISTGYSHLRLMGETAAGLNQLGIAHYLGGDLDGAAYCFSKAVELEPDDAGYRRNREQALARLEPGTRSMATAGSETGTESGTRGDRLEVTDASFYWGEAGD